MARASRSAARWWPSWKTISSPTAASWCRAHWGLTWAIRCGLAEASRVAAESPRQPPGRDKKNAASTLIEAAHVCPAAQCLVAVAHHEAQHIPEHQRDRCKELHRGGDVAVFRIVMNDVRGVVQHRGAREADHRHREPGAQLE